jgi:hypothetical protein
MADIVLISPRFEPSFWGSDYALRCSTKRRDDRRGVFAARHTDRSHQ